MPEGGLTIEQPPVTTRSEFVGIARRAEPLQSLNPEQVLDEEGNQRIIYTFRTKDGKPVRAMFYSPEELPFSHEAIKGRQAFVYGDKPKWRPEEEWNEFIKKVRNTSTSIGNPLSTLSTFLTEAVQGGNSLFLVEATPLHILDFAFTLGVEDKDLRGVRREIFHRRLNPQASELLDKIIAGKIIDDAGNLRSESSYDGEELTVLSLLGNQQAKEALEERKDRLQAIDQEREARQKKELLEDKAKDKEPLKLEDLVAVHLTRYLPRKVNGSFEMLSTFDATDWRLPRNTIHFSLNHPVASHFWGSWGNAPYAVITPLDKLIEINEKPSVLNTVDTFFEISPGTSLKLPPETVIVKPGIVKNGLFQREGNEVVYKTNNITPQDLATLVNRLSQQEKKLLNGEVVADINDYFNTPFLVEQGLSAEDSALLGKILYSGQYRGPMDILQPLEEKPLQDILARILIESDLEEKLTKEAKNKLVAKVEAKLLTRIKEQAVRETMREMGYEDMWAPAGREWSASHFTGKSLEEGEATQRVQLLATQMGIPALLHSHDATAKATKVLLDDLLGKNIDAHERLKRFNQERKWIMDEMLPKITPKTRRTLYLMGII